MNSLIVKKIFLSILLFIPIFGLAQDGLGLRTGISVKKDISNKWKAEVQLQTRFNGNISFLQTYLGEAGVSYKIIKGLEASAFYRYVYRRKNTEKAFKERHRYYADLSYGKKLGTIKLEYRLRYQHQFKDNDLGEAEFDNSYLRNKLEAAYAGKGKFRPYVSADLFYQVGNRLDQIRPKLGADLRFNKRNILDLSVFKDVDLTRANTYSPVVGVNYTYKF